MAVPEERQKEKPEKKNRSTIFLLAVFVTGLCLLLYPSVSDYWNSFHQSYAISSYEQALEQLDSDAYDHLWEEAEAFNQNLLKKRNRYYFTEEEEAEYYRMLSVDTSSANGIMGYIEIPAIHISLPLYHGVDEAYLQVAVGHMPGTSLPTGGENTHCVLSGHRGLPSAKLFTNLDQLVIGDYFVLRVLDQVMTYEVDQILIVEPDDISALEIEPGQDLCTLVTCTPYGINTHRMLVRGHRIDNPTAVTGNRVPADAVQIEPLLVAPIMAAVILTVLVGWMLFSTRKRK